MSTDNGGGTTTSVFLVTGASGRTGGHAARVLLERGHEVRALVRRFDDRAAALRDLGADVVVGDLDDLNDVRKAADGATGAYFVHPIAPGLVEATATFAQAASEAGVQAVVNMSQISAQRDAGSHAARNHWLGERVLDWSPLLATHIRPTFFAEWFLIFDWSVAGGVIRFPFGDGRHAPVTAEDQGRVIAAILERPEEHAGKTYPLVGPVEMDHHEIADVIARTTGRPMRYEPATIDAWTRELQDHGGSPFLAQHLGQVAVDYRDGVFAGTNDIVETVGGSAPTSFGEFVASHLDAFTR
jgi:NAD(P)H dehydrogenase (quinone)